MSPPLSALRSLVKRRPVTSLGLATGTGLVGAATAVEYVTEIHSSSSSNTDNIIKKLPREYSAREIDAYWMARPVTASARLFQIAYELGPIAASYLLQDAAALWSSSLSQQQKQEQQQVRLARRLRQALTNLGPAFVKAGQQLSIRPDLCPPAVLKELQKLCDSVEPVPDEIALQVLRGELGLNNDEDDEDDNGTRRWDKLFESPPELVASASLGQVYRATLRAGAPPTTTTKGTANNHNHPNQEESEKQNPTVVAIKVQRPNARREFSLDLFWLHVLGATVDRFTSTFTQQPPFHQALYQSFAAASYAELDYEQEAANQEYFRKELAQRKHVPVRIPAVHEHLTTERVLTSEWIDGKKLSDCPREQIRQLIPVGVELFLTQLLDIGAFHSDPHCANLLVTNDTGQLVLLDFGLVTTVPLQERNAMTTAIVHLLTRDFDALVGKDAVDLGFLPADFDSTELQPLLTKIITTGLVESSSNLHERKRKFMDISNELNEVFFMYPFSVPPFFALVTRGLGLLEGIALIGDPEFDIFQASAPYARRRAVSLLGAKALFRRLTQQNNSNNKRWPQQLTLVEICDANLLVVGLLVYILVK